MKMKLTLKRILTSVLAGAMLLFSCAFVGCGEQVKEMPSGVFYTLKEAYENNYITRNDLLNIAYHSYSANHNPEIDEDFQPIEKGELGEDIKQKIVEEYVKQYNQTNPNAKLKANDFRISNYFGRYNGSICFSISKIVEEDPNLYAPAEVVIIRSELDGVVFLLDINHIMLWKEVNNEN